MSKLTTVQLTEVARQFRNPKATRLDQAKLQASVPSTQQAEFIALVEKLGDNTGVQPYTNKAGEVTGVIVHAKGTGKRGMYISDEALGNLSEIFAMVDSYIKSLK